MSTSAGTLFVAGTSGTGEAYERRPTRGSRAAVGYRDAMRAPLRTAVATAALVALARGAEGGGAPETTLVVVNADSPDSMRVGNEYVRRRKIPATHVVAIGGVPASGEVSVEVFRESLWKPVR